MHDVQKLNLLLTELGLRHGIANLQLSTQGAVGLRLKDGTELFLEHDEEQATLYAYTPILSLPKANDARLRIFTHMLEMNFLGSGTAHRTLSVQRDMAICHISIAIADLQMDALERSLHCLLMSRARLVERLKSSIWPEKSEVSHGRRSTASLMAVLK